MRIELETTHTPLDEFIDSLPAHCKTVEFVRDGVVVARMAMTNADRKAARSSGKKQKPPHENGRHPDKNQAWLARFMQSVWDHAEKREPKLSERELVKEANAVVASVRRQRASRAR